MASSFSSCSRYDFHWDIPNARAEFANALDRFYVQGRPCPASDQPGRGPVCGNTFRGLAVRVLSSWLATLDFVSNSESPSGGSSAGVHGGFHASSGLLEFTKYSSLSLLPSHVGSSAMISEAGAQFHVETGEGYI